MPNKVEQDNLAQLKPQHNPTRRKFLLVFPVAVIATIAGTVAAAAFRFLRPFGSAKPESQWLDAIPMANVKGDKPMMCTVMTERMDGWSMAQEEQQVFILPAKNRQALSSACPHEGCAVTWRDETNDFLCPCHDSTFGSDGAVLSGPARRGLDPLPMRENNGMLQVQFQTFVNNIVERVPRA